MPFRFYSASLKTIAVRMLLQDKTENEVRDIVGESIHHRRFNRWMDLFATTLRVIRDPEEYEKRGRPLVHSDEDREFITQLVAEQPQVFLDEICVQIYDSQGVLPSLKTVHNELNRRLHLTLKKAHTSHIHKDFYRKALWDESMDFVPAEALVFTDESSICERELMRVSGRSPSGDRVTRWLKRMNPKKYSILPAIGLNGIIAMTVREGTMDRPRFEQFLEFMLLPAMNPYPGVNSILVMDNAPIHHGGQIAELCEARGVWLMYLPPYCPELNPIETCFYLI